MIRLGYSFSFAAKAACKNGNGMEMFQLSRSTFATFKNRKPTWQFTDRSDDRSKTRKSEAQPFQRHELVLKEYVNSANDLSDLKQQKEILLKQFGGPQLNDTSFNAIFMRICLACRNYPLGKMFFYHLKEDKNNPINTATLKAFIQLSYFCRDKADLTEVEELCNFLSQNEILDGPATESLILGFSITDSWKKAVKLLEEFETSIGSVCYNAVVDCLLAHDEPEAAARWMDTMVLKKKNVFEFVFQHWLKKCDSDSPSAFVYWESLSAYLSRNGNVFVSENVVKSIKDLLERRSGLKGRFTSVVMSSGLCRACNHKLENSEITAQQFTALRNAMFERVLTGTDVYCGSSPAEVSYFQEFVQQTAPYDVVIDGLNVAFMKGQGADNHKKAKLISMLVKHLSVKYKRILVLGRIHMKAWSPSVMAEVRGRAKLFLLENLSRDDTFILYAALQNYRTKIISDDLFRDALFRLADPELETVFRKWQRSSQLQIARIDPYASTGSQVVIQEALKHSTVAQRNPNNGAWHIPYDDGSPRFSYQLPNNWLCLTPKQDNTNFNSR